MKEVITFKQLWCLTEAQMFEKIDQLFTTDITKKSLEDEWYKRNNKIKSRFYRQIIKNTYIQKQSSSNKKKIRNIDSISFLLKTPITQSQSIRLGIALEKLFVYIILENNNLELHCLDDGKKLYDNSECDHLFIDKTGNIFYAEIKSNLNLDSEKFKTTIKNNV